MALKSDKQTIKPEIQQKSDWIMWLNGKINTINQIGQILLLALAWYQNQATYMGKISFLETSKGSPSNEGLHGEPGISKEAEAYMSYFLIAFLVSLW